MLGRVNVMGERDRACADSVGIMRGYLNSSSTNCEEEVVGKGKGQAVSLQAWGGPEGSRKLRF